MKTTFFAALLATVVQIATAADIAPPKTIFGAFSNEAEGFYTKSVLLTDQGKGMFQGVPMLWTHDPKTHVVTVTLPPDAPLEVYTFKLRFDPAEEVLTILDQKLAEGSKPLHRVRGEIPVKVVEMLKKFDGTMKSIRQ